MKERISIVSPVRLFVSFCMQTLALCCTSNVHVPCLVFLLLRVGCRRAKIKKGPRACGAVVCVCTGDLFDTEKIKGFCCCHCVLVILLGTCLGWAETMRVNMTFFLHVRACEDIRVAGQRSMLFEKCIRA